MATELKDVLGAIGTNIAEIEQNKSNLDNIYQVMQQHLLESADQVARGTVTTSKGVRTTPEAFVQEQLADKAVQDANRARAETVGFEELSNKQLSIIKQEGERTDNLLAEAERINNGNIFEQVVGMFTIPYIAEQVNSSQARKNNATQTLAATNQLMQQSAATTASIQERVTDATMASMNKALQADRLADAAKINAQVLATGADRILKLTQMSGQQLDGIVKGYQLQMSAEQMAAMRQERKLRAEAMNEQLRKEKRTDQAFALINAGAAANGKNPFPAEMKDIMLAQLDKSPQLQAFFRMGLDLTVSPTGEFSQGSTPAEAMEFRNSINYVPTSKEEAHTLSVVNGLMSDKSIQMEKTAAGRANRYNELVKTKLEQDQTNINNASDSLTKPVSWATMAQSSELTALPAWQKVIAPEITDNISTNAAEPEQVFDRLVTGVVDGRINIKDATKFYGRYAAYSVEMNNRAFNLEKLTGMKQTKFITKLPQPQDSAIALAIKAPFAALPESVTGAGIIADFLTPTQRKSVDALDPVELNNAFAKQITSRLKKGVK